MAALRQQNHQTDRGINRKGENTMPNYFRITAYHPEQDLSAIFDSNGYFEKLWQFSAYLIQKGFKIIEVGNEEKFDEGDMPKAERDTVHIILRACKSGQPDIHGNTIMVEGKSYFTKQV